MDCNNDETEPRFLIGMMVVLALSLVPGCLPDNFSAA